MVDLKQVLKESQVYAMEIKAAAGRTQGSVQSMKGSDATSNTQKKSKKPISSGSSKSKTSEQPLPIPVNGSQEKSLTLSSVRTTSQSQDRVSATQKMKSRTTKRQSQPDSHEDQAKEVGTLSGIKPSSTIQADASAPSAALLAHRSRVTLENTYQGVDAEGAKGVKLVPLRLMGRKEGQMCLHGPCEYDHCIEARVPMNWIELWCTKADCSVVDLARCPRGLWTKNPDTQRMF